MNEIETANAFQPQNFDYDQLDSQTADFLKQRVSNMERIADDTRYRMGRELSKAQEKLANHYQGVFVEWYESLGLKKDNVYFWINEFKFSRNLENTQQVANFGSLPKTLKHDIMKKNAPEEAKQAVLNGDIKTHKEYKALVEKLNAKERELADAKETIADQEEQLDGHRKREVELNQRLTNASKTQRVVEKPVEKVVTKEVKPKDYDGMKQQLSDMRKANDDLTNHLRDTAVENDKLKKQLNDYENLDKQNSQVKHWQNKGKITVYKVNDKMREFLTEMKLMSDDRKAIEDAGESALEDLNSRLDDMQSFIDDMRKLTNGRRTVEGEIVQ